MREYLRPALTLLALFSLLCGVIYPFAVTGIAGAALPTQAQGSLVVREGKVIGSELIGQAFTSPRYFHGRPSAASYDASASSGSNLGPTSKALVERIATEAAKLKLENPALPVPADLVYASASGLDPDISPEAAAFQLPRVAAARGLPVATVQAQLRAVTAPRTFGLLGEPSVNVLALNRALDAITP